MELYVGKHWADDVRAVASYAKPQENLFRDAYVDLS